VNPGGLRKGILVVGASPPGGTCLSIARMKGVGDGRVLQGVPPKPKPNVGNEGIEDPMFRLGPPINGTVGRVDGPPFGTKLAAATFGT
jgi:hypothetical protein